MSLRGGVRSVSSAAPAKPPSLHEELTFLSEELANGKLVKNLTLFPSIQITLVHPDMVREFEQSCQVSICCCMSKKAKYLSGPSMSAGSGLATNSIFFCFLFVKTH